MFKKEKQLREFEINNQNMIRGLHTGINGFKMGYQTMAVLQEFFILFY